MSEEKDGRESFSFISAVNFYKTLYELSNGFEGVEGGFKWNFYSDSIEVDASRALVMGFGDNQCRYWVLSQSTSNPPNEAKFLEKLGSLLLPTKQVFVCTEFNVALITEKLLQSHCPNRSIARLEPDHYYVLDASKLPELLDTVKNKYGDDGYSVRPMSSGRDVDEILESWAFTQTFTRRYVELACRYELCVGAFDRHDNPVAWILTDWCGCLGSLRTKPGHRNKGLASRVIAAQAKILVEKLGFAAVWCWVQLDNEISPKLFSSLGFERRSEMTYIVELGHS